MKLTIYEWWRPGRIETLCWIVVGLLGMTFAQMTDAQGVSTTTVQGTVYLANGQAGAGTLVVSWPAFTTATGQAVAADSITETIPADGFVSVNLAPNVGALPAGEYYTAVFYMSDGSVSTQYWQVPAGAQATLAQVETQVMPASQAVQAVSKSYVDQSITEMTQSLLTASGGTLSGPLVLNGDPTQALQAATKHYVDTQVATDVPLAGGNMTGALGTPAVNGVQAPEAGSAQTTLQQAINAAGPNGAMEIPPTYAGMDTFTNANGVKVTDLRTSGSQQTKRSVKEFGAVCDGVTDDTNALQAALNYADTHGVALTIPEGTCKTHSLNWHGESIGGMGKQVSALMGFPGQDVLASMPDSPNLLQNTRLHDFTIYVDQSVDVSCSPAEGRAAGGSCQVSRLMEKNSIFSPGGNGLTSTAGAGAAWAVGNCAIAMSAATGTGGNGLRVAEIENLEIAATGTDPMAAQYPGAHSTHTCGMYLAQWPQWSEFRNIDIRGLNTGIAIPALPVTTPAGLNADSNRWQNVTIQATHAFTAAAGSNNVLDNVVAMAGNSAATSEPPTGLVLDFAGTQQGWTVRNAVVLPTWTAVQPALMVTAANGAVTAVTLGTEHGLGWDPYGTSVPVAFSGSCTAQATATVNSGGAIGSVSVLQGGVGCSSTTTASVNAAGTWDTAAPVNLIGGQDMTLFAGNLLKGNGGYTVWNAASSASYGTQLDGGGGTLPGGGAYAALVANNQLGSTLLVDQFPGADIGAKIQACLGAVSASYGGTCDARNFTGNLSMASNLTISTGNTTVLLPCATITTANQVIVTPGTRNVALRGCALRGGSAASGSQGGTAFAYSGTGAMVQVGDPTYAADTLGFHMDNVVINTTAASAGATGLIAYRTQEMDLESLYLLGNGNQTGMTLDGTGNYTGGTFLDDEIGGFQTAVNAIGHQLTNPATTDWMNASTFVRLHIDCPTSGGSPISGTYGINLQQGDGNTFTGGDVEGCSTALHLGANAQNNTIVGLRNENSTSQVVADAGSSYNNWMTGGTMFTGQLTDNGTRNSFLDTFHRSFNGLNGDWYGSQQDATVTNHYRLGTGAGNERGLLNEVQTDYGYRWLEGYSDATSGEQLYQVEDLLNNVNRLSIGQYNHGQSNTNNQTVINAAGTGAVVLNGSNNAGTGGMVIGSGGASATTVATISNAGNAQFNGTLQVGGTAQSAGTMTVRNNADAEVDYYLWPGLTTSQKGSFTYKDWNGSSQWYMVKDTSNNWALNSAVGGLDSFKAYQSTNSGDTYIDASNSTGHVRLNYESGAGAETDIYSGSSSNLDAAFLSPTSIKFPGLAAGSGHYCLQIDNSGYLTNTGSACGTGAGGGSGTVSAGSTGQIAYYTNNGTVVGGMNLVPVTEGGTGATTAAGAVSNLLPGVSSDGANGLVAAGTIAAGTSVTAPQVGAVRLADSFGGSTCDAKIAAADAAIGSATGVIQVGVGCGSTFAAPLTISTNHALQFLASASGTYSISGAITLSLGSAIYGPPSASNASFPVILQEANGANLPALVVMSSGSTIENLRLDGNKANNSSAEDVVLVNNANRIHIDNTTIANAYRDNIHVTNTHYPAPTPSEVLALATILTINTSSGGQALFNTTTAGTGTNSYPSCASGTVGATCTWGTALLTSIRSSTYDDTSGSGYLGPNVLLSDSGRDAFFGERISDWIIGTQVEFQTAARDGLHCEDCGGFNISGANIGANARYGLYKAVVNAQCSSGVSSTGWTISGSQFGNNASGDIYDNGSSASAPNFCSVPTGSNLAGEDAIAGNVFENPVGSGINSITFADAGGNEVEGNVFGDLYYQQDYQYLVVSSFSTVTGTARLPSTVRDNSTLPFSYAEPMPYSLASSVDLGCYTSAQATETCSQNEVYQGAVSATLANGSTATTQSPGDNSTKVATTAYANTAANAAVANSWQIVYSSVGTSDTVSCPNDTTSNFATSYTIPANTLAAKTLLRLTIGITFTSSGSPPTMGFDLSLGGNSVYSAYPEAPNTGLTGVSGGQTFLIRGTAAPSGSAAVYTSPLGVPGGAGANFSPFNNSQVAVSRNLATNGALVIQPALFCSANTAGNSVTINQFIVEEATSP